MILRLGFISCIIIGLLCSCSNNDRQSEKKVIHNVFVTHPEVTGYEIEAVLPATVEEGRMISVGFKTGGQIKNIFVKEGSNVVKGQLIAELDAEDYSLGVASLREKYTNLKAETERQTKLHASGNMSDNDYEKALSGLKQLELQLQLEENRLSYCRLTSPSAGIVTKVNFENSEMVDAGTPIIELMDNSSLEAIVDLPARLYSNRNFFTEFIGQSGLHPAKEVPLTMLSLTPRADNTQLYKLRLGVPSNSGFTPGMNIKVRIISAGNGDKTKLYVPISAVFDDNGQKYVWSVHESDSIVTATPIVISGTGENGIVEVTDGLSPDNLIVRAGVRHLVNGEKVNIISTESATNPGNML